MDLSWIKGIYVVWFGVGFVMGWSCAAVVFAGLIRFVLAQVPRRQRSDGR